MEQEDKIKEEFSNWAEDYGKVEYSFWKGDLSEEHEEARKRAVELLQPEKDDNVLDAACGVGWGAIRIANIVEKGKAVGIDVTKEMVLKAREHAEKVGVENTEFKNSSVKDIPYPDSFL